MRSRSRENLKFGHFTLWRSSSLRNVPIIFIAWRRALPTPPLVRYLMTTRSYRFSGKLQSLFNQRKDGAVCSSIVKG